MSKRHYQAIARAFYSVGQTPIPASAGADGAVWAIHALRDKIADVLAEENYRFNRALFVEACETGRCKGMRA